MLRLEVNSPIIVRFGYLIVQLRLDILPIVTKFFYDERNDNDGTKSYCYAFQDALLGQATLECRVEFNGPVNVRYGAA